MSREQQTIKLINDLGGVKATEVLLADIALSLAQIADALNAKVTLKLDGETISRTLDGREIK